MRPNQNYGQFQSHFHRYIQYVHYITVCVISSSFLLYIKSLDGVLGNSLKLSIMSLTSLIANTSLVRHRCSRCNMLHPIVKQYPFLSSTICHCRIYLQWCWLFSSIFPIYAVGLIAYNLIVVPFVPGMREISILCIDKISSPFALDGSA